MADHRTYCDTCKGWYWPDGENIERHRHGTTPSEPVDHTCEPEADGVCLICKRGHVVGTNLRDIAPEVIGFVPPWTAGPWSVHEEIGRWILTSPHASAINCHEVADVYEKEPDAALIALAPEMAAAIMAAADDGAVSHQVHGWGDNTAYLDDACIPECQGCSHERLADKLRAIQGDA